MALSWDKGHGAHPTSYKRAFTGSKSFCSLFLKQIFKIINIGKFGKNLSCSKATALIKRSLLVVQTAIIMVFVTYFSWSSLRSGPLILGSNHNKIVQCKLDEGKKEMKIHLVTNSIWAEWLKSNFFYFSIKNEVGIFLHSSWTERWVCMMNAFNLWGKFWITLHSLLHIQVLWFIDLNFIIQICQSRELSVILRLSA